MKGTAFWVMLSEATPGYPAPEMACSVVAATAATPNRAASGANASAIITVAQFGFATMNPPPVPLQASSSARWSGFTSGISSGTASFMRCGDELVTTRYPARANRVSTGPATSDGRLENTTSQSSGGSGAWTTRPRTAAGAAP